MLIWGRSIVREAAADGADLVAFPEMWSTGYALPIDPATAQPVDGPFVDGFQGDRGRAGSRRLGDGAAGGSVGADELRLAHRAPRPGVAATRQGAPARGRGSRSRPRGPLRHRLVRWCRGRRDDVLGNASSPSGPRAHVGGGGGHHRAECDGLEPHPLASTRGLSLREHGRDRVDQLSRRRLGPVVGLHADVFDPRGRPLSALLAQADARAQYVPFRFDLDALRDWRDREVWGARYRRPEAYHRLRRGGHRYVGGPGLVATGAD